MYTYGSLRLNNLYWVNVTLFKSKNYRKEIFAYFLPVLEVYKMFKKLSKNIKLLYNMILLL